MTDQLPENNVNNVEAAKKLLEELMKLDDLLAWWKFLNSKLAEISEKALALWDEWKPIVKRIRRAQNQIKRWELRIDLTSWQEDLKKPWESIKTEWNKEAEIIYTIISKIAYGNTVKEKELIKNVSEKIVDSILIKLAKLEEIGKTPDSIWYELLDWIDWDEEAYVFLEKLEIALDTERKKQNLKQLDTKN